MPYFNFEKILKSAKDVIFPEKCLGCNKEGSWLCKKCFRKININKKNTCPSCSKITQENTFCLNCKKYYYLKGIIISAQYKDPLKETIHYLKYNKILELVDPLCEILAEKLQYGFPHGDLVIIPVPLHPQREKERGFNQATIIAKKIGKIFDLPIYDDILIRIKNTPPQINLSRKLRRKNIKGAFKINKSKIKKITGKTVIIFDDVMTTGATLNEAARVLNQAGFKNIWGLVLAKG